MRKRQPDSEILYCRITKSDKAKIQALSLAYDVPISSVVRTLIREAQVPTR